MTWDLPAWTWKTLAWIAGVAAVLSALVGDWTGLCHSLTDVGMAAYIAHLLNRVRP